MKFKSMSQTLIQSVSVLSIGLVLGGAMSFQAQAAKGQNVVRIALAEEPPQLNGTKATDQVSFFILGHVMEGLARYDKRNRLTQGVAKKWDIRADGATFWLREDAKWSDGKPVVAKDFVYGWQTVVDPKTASEYAFIMFPLKNAEAINKGNKPVTDLGVKAVGDHQLEVQFEKPCGYFLSLTAFGTYFPVREDFHKAQKDKYGAEAANLLYNGPFKLTKWVHGASLRLEKNPLYWNKKAIKIDAIDAPYITADTNARFNLFKDKKIDFVALDSETLKSALAEKYKIRKFSDGAVFYLEFNFRDGRVTGNKNLRKAIQAVYDPTELVDKVLAVPGNKPAYSLFPSWLKGVDNSFQKEYPVAKRKPDLKKAKEYLEAAKKELGLKKIPPLHYLTGDNPTSSKQAEYMQSLLKEKLGIELKIDKQIFKQRLAKMTSGEFDIVAAGWGPDFDDPMTFADLFASWNENNRGRYKGAEYDKAIRTAQASADAKVRMDAMAKVQKIINEEVVILPQYERGVVYVQSPRVRGVVRSVVGADPNYTYVTIKK